MYNPRIKELIDGLSEIQRVSQVTNSGWNSAVMIDLSSPLIDIQFLFLPLICSDGPWKVSLD